MTHQLLITFESEVDLESMLKAIEEAEMEGTNEAPFNVQRDPQRASDFANSDEPSELEQENRGFKIAQMCMLEEAPSLHPHKPAYRLSNDYGDKTALGLYRTMKAIIEGDSHA